MALPASAVPSLDLDSAAALLKKCLAELPELLLAELVGSFAAGQARERSDIDLVLVVDVADSDALYYWRRAQLDKIYSLENELGREIHVTCFDRNHFHSEAERSSGFLTTLCASPHLPLLASLAEVLAPEMLAVLEAKALVFLEGLEPAQLTPAYRAGLRSLRAY